MAGGKYQHTIAAVFGEGPVYQCGQPDCGKLYANPQNLNHHYGIEHVGSIGKNFIRPRREFFQSVEFERREEMINQE
jgi:hypothetical protein